MDARTVSAFSRPSARGGLSRAKRQSIVRAKQRALIRAGMRGLPPTSFRFHRSGDKKGVDTSLTLAGPVVNTTNTNGDAFVLNLIQAGNGSWNRIGRKVNLHSVRLTGLARFIYSAQATTSNIGGTMLRMVVVWDKQPSGAAIPNFDTIFGNTVQGGTESATILDNLRYDNVGRFRVLRDLRVFAEPKTTPATGGTQNLVSFDLPFDEYIKLNKRTIYSGESAPMTIADISSGALYVYFRAFGSTNDAVDWAILAGSIARLRYTDF